MSRKDKIPTQLQDPNFIGKTLSGSINYTGEELVEGANVATNFLGRVGGPLGIGLSAVGSDMAADREERQINRTLHGNMRSMRFMPAVKTKLGELRGRWKEGAVSATAGLAGMAAATGIAASVMTGPPGWITGLLVGGAGAMAGGYAGSKAYKQFAGQIQDTVEIVTRVSEAQNSGQAVPDEVVFAALASKLRGKDAKIASDLLRKETGTKYFHEAVAQGKIDELGKLMNNPQMERALRRQTGMPLDMGDVGKSVAAQYAEYINNGRLKARHLLRQRFSPVDLKPIIDQSYIPGAMDVSTPSQIPMSPYQGGQPLVR